MLIENYGELTFKTFIWGSTGVIKVMVRLRNPDFLEHFLYFIRIKFAIKPKTIIANIFK